MMKKIFSFISFLVLLISVMTSSAYTELGALSTCDDPPAVYDINTSTFNVTNGDPFILGVDFYNQCNHIIKEVLINGVRYTVGDGTISNQGYTTTILPGGSRAYSIQIPLIYDSSTMALSFTITHFIYSEWYGVFPNDIVVDVNQSFDDPTILDDGYEPPSDDTSDEMNYYNFRVSFDSDSLTIINDDTGETETYLYNNFFDDSVLATYSTTFLDNEHTPQNITIDTFKDLVMDAIVDIGTTSSITGYNSQYIYNDIFGDNKNTDIMLNIVIDIMEAYIQIDNPSYEFPNNYIWIDGILTRVILDTDGNILLDSDGNMIIDDGTFSEDLDELPLWIQRLLQDWGDVIAENLVEKLNINWDVTGKLIDGLTWAWNHLGFIIITVILIVLGILAWPVTGPILMFLLMMPFKGLILLLKGVYALSEFLAHQMYTKDTRKAKF